MHKVTCETCKKSFDSKWEDAEECYDCALERFSGGGAPEEGEFNSARIVSGEAPTIQYEAVEDGDPYWIQLLDDGVEDEHGEADLTADEEEAFPMPEPLDSAEFYTD